MKEHSHESRSRTTSADALPAPKVGKSTLVQDDAMTTPALADSPWETIIPSGKPIDQNHSLDASAHTSKKGKKRLAARKRLNVAPTVETRYYSHGVKTTELTPISELRVLEGPPKGTKSKIKDSLTLETTYTVRTEATKEVEASIGLATAILGVSAGAKASWTYIEEFTKGETYTQHIEVAPGETITAQRFARVAHIPVSIETWVGDKRAKDVPARRGTIKILVADVVKYGRK